MYVHAGGKIEALGNAGRWANPRAAGANGTNSHVHSCCCVFFFTTLFMQMKEMKVPPRPVRWRLYVWWIYEITLRRAHRSPMNWIR